MWANYPRVHCKSFCNLVELIERDLDLENLLEILKGSFEHDDEVANVYNVGRIKFFIFFSVFFGYF